MSSALSLTRFEVTSPWTSPRLSFATVFVGNFFAVIHWLLGDIRMTSPRSVESHIFALYQSVAQYFPMSAAWPCSYGLLSLKFYGWKQTWQRLPVTAGSNPFVCTLNSFLFNWHGQVLHLYWRTTITVFGIHLTEVWLCWNTTGTGMKWVLYM